MLKYADNRQEHRNRTLVEVDRSMPEVPVKSDETRFLQYIWYLRAVFEQGLPCLTERLNATGQMKNYKWLLSMMNKLFVKLYSSLPEKKRDAFTNLTWDQSLYIKAKSMGNHGQTTTILTDDLCTVMDELQKEKCDLCVGGADEMRTCPVRKAVHGICMVCLDQEEAKGCCVGRQMDWK